MGKFGTTDEGGLEKYTGYVMVGPPFVVRQEFYQPEGEWAQGRWSSVIAGKIHQVLDWPVYSYDGEEKHVAPQEAVGHQMAFFCQHPLKNHVVGDGYDDYRYLASRQDRWGRWWPNFTTEMVLSKVGASTKGLDVHDNDELIRQIIALLNTGEPFPVAMWDSRQGDIERQIPKGTEVLCNFYRFLYWDHKRERPTWVPYEAQGDSGPYTVRDVTFLLRVVAPNPWTGTILRLPVNYTIKRGESDEGSPMWSQHEMANFSDVMKTLGVAAEDFAETVDESLLMEVEVGEPANWLGPLESALQDVSDRRLLHVVIPDRHSIKFKHIKIADQMVVEKITGQESFKPPVLRSITDLSEQEIDAASQEPEEEIPGLESSSYEEWSRQKAVDFLNKLSSITVWEKADGSPPTEKGMDWGGTYLVPVLRVVGLNKSAPQVGWTDEIAEKAERLLNDDTFKAACKDSADAAVEYGENLLEASVSEQKDDSGF